MLRRSVRGRRLRRRADQFIGEHQPGALYIGQIHLNRLAGIELDLGDSCLRAKHRAGQSFAALQCRHRHIDAREMAGEPNPIFQAGQRPVNASRADFQRPRPLNRVFDIEPGGDQMCF